MKIFIILLTAAGKEVQICIFPANQGGTSSACHPGPLPATHTSSARVEGGFPTPSTLPPTSPGNNLEGKKEPWRLSLLTTLPDALPRDSVSVYLSSAPDPPELSTLSQVRTLQPGFSL